MLWQTSSFHYFLSHPKAKHRVLKTKSIQLLPWDFMDGRLAALLLIFAVDIVFSYAVTVILKTALGTLSNWKFIEPALDRSPKKQPGF